MVLANGQLPLYATAGSGAHQQVLSGLVEDPGGLPDGAIAYADFKNGTYYYGGNTLADFLTEDEAWGTFDPVTDVVSGSGIGESLPVVATALTADLIVGGFIFVAALGDIPDETSFTNFQVSTWVDPNPAFYNQCRIARETTQDSIIEVGGDPETLLIQKLATGTNKIAIEFDGDTISASTNGGSIESDTASAPVTIDRIGISFGASGVDGWWESVVLYPAGHAALNTLSAL